MDYYHIWFNLRDTHKDLEFVDALNTYMEHIKANGGLEDYHLTRRKLGFGPNVLGEFHLTIETRDLAQLDHAFGHVAARTGKLEQLHAGVYRMVADFQAALYRDFPDPQRQP